MGIIDRIVSAIGRRVDESSPMVDARLADGSRVNAIIPPLAVDGPCMSIRRFGRERLERPGSACEQNTHTLDAGIASGLREGAIEHLDFRRHRRRQDDFPQRLSSYISNRERIVTIEDAAELQLHQEHVVRLETVLPISKAKVQSSSANSSSTHCACARTASSSVRCAAKKRSTCCRQ